MALRPTLLLLAFGALLFACPGPTESEEVCEGVACGNGRCVVDQGEALCLCDPGASRVNGTCVIPSTEDACATNPCTEANRSVCTPENGQAVCSCDSGYTLQSGACVSADLCQPDPCTTVPHKSVCSAATGVAVCACEMGYVDDGVGGCEELIVTECSGQHATGDAFEPDECIALARDIGTTGDQDEAHTIGPATDVDFFQISSPQQGRIYRLSAGGPGSPTLLVSQVDAQGEVLAQTDAAGTASPSLATRAQSTAPIFFRVASQPVSQTGNYTVSLADEGTDDFADAPLDAQPLAAFGSPVPGKLQFHDDEDLFKLPLTGGRTYEFELEGDGVLDDLLKVEFLDRDGSTVLSSGKANALGLRVYVLTSGTYFARVSASGSATHAFTLSVTDLGGDDHGDLPAFATSVVPSGNTAAVFNRESDVDVFKWVPVQNHIYRFDCATPGSEVCTVELLDPAGTMFAARADSLSWEFHQSGDYFFRMRVSGASTFPRSYSWSLVDLGIDDHGDEATTATLVTSFGTTDTSASWELTGDVDFLEFEALAGHVYTIGCYSAQNCDAWLYDAAGTQLQADTTSALTAAFSHKAQTAATLFVKLKGQQSGGYTWQIRDGGLEDHGDDLMSATPVTTFGNTPISAWWETRTDWDFFSFSAQPGRTYQIVCQSHDDCDATLFNSAGTSIGTDTGSSNTAVLTYANSAATAQTISFALRSGKLASAPFSIRSYTWYVQDTTP